MGVHLRGLRHRLSVMQLGLHLVLAAPVVAGQLSPTDTTESATASACHAFVDFENIWTVELIRSRDENVTPILNIITFTKGEWDLRPDQIHIFNRKGKEARIKRFALDTGVPGDAYKSNYLKVLGNSFVGVDLEGKLKDFPSSPRVTIDWPTIATSSSRWTAKPSTTWPAGSTRSISTVPTSGKTST